MLIIDVTHESTSALDLFNTIKSHVPERERTRSGIESFAERTIIRSEFSTAHDFPAKPRRATDSMALLLTALLVFLAITAFILVPAYFFA